MKDKLVYFVMGNQGSGKTVLANNLASKVKGQSEIFDDFHFLSMNREYVSKIRNEVSSVRHSGKTIFICSHSTKFLHSNWNVRDDPYVTWILTSISWEELVELSKHYSKKYLRKLYKAYRNVCRRKGLKTRPYLSITLNQNRTGLKYEYHRYKRLNLREDAQ